MIIYGPLEVKFVEFWGHVGRTVEHANYTKRQNVLYDVYDGVNDKKILLVPSHQKVKISYPLIYYEWHFLTPFECSGVFIHLKSETFISNGTLLLF